MHSEMMVYIVVFDKTAYALSEKLFSDVESYIDERMIESIHESEYRREPYGRRLRYMNERERRFEEYERRFNIREQFFEERECMACEDEIRSMRPDIEEKQSLEIFPMASAVSSSKKEKSLEDLIGRAAETFSEALIRMIDERGFKDPEVYKKANISKQHFSKIKNSKDYQPKKSTALAFAVALKLNLDETKDLIGKAGYLLTPSSKFDIIVEYFIVHNNYDIFELNEVLFAFTDQILGS